MEWNGMEWMDGWTGGQTNGRDESKASMAGNRIGFLNGIQDDTENGQGLPALGPQHMVLGVRPEVTMDFYYSKCCALVFSRPLLGALNLLVSSFPSHPINTLRTLPVQAPRGWCQVLGA